jgi:hypothetical protein
LGGGLEAGSSGCGPLIGGCSVTLKVIEAIAKDSDFSRVAERRVKFLQAGCN